MNSSDLNPYKLQIQIVLAVLALCTVAAAGLYVRHVFNDRDRLDRENALLKKDVEAGAKMLQLTNQISEAISQIKIRSNVNVSRIETEQKPVFVDSRPVVLIPGGLLQSVYSSGSAGRAAPGNAVGGDVATGQPGG